MPGGPTWAHERLNKILASLGDRVGKSVLRECHAGHTYALSVLLMVRVYSGICTLGMVSDLPDGPHADYLLLIYSLCSNIVITWMILGFWICPVSSRRCTAFVFKTWLPHHLTSPWTYGLRKVACIQGLQTREDLVALPLPLEIH